MELRTGSRWILLAGACLLASLTITRPMQAQAPAPLQAGEPDSALSPSANPREHAAIRSDKRAYVSEIVNRWNDQYVATGERWNEQLTHSLSKLRPDRLALAKYATTYEELLDVLHAKTAPPGGDDPNVLGDLNSDSVYYQVAPCRIFDTRVAQGKFNNTETRSYWTYGADFVPQGGNPALCNIPGEVAAIALTITVINGEGFGFTRAWAQGGPVPFASTNNYQGLADIHANTTIIPLNQVPGQQEFSVRVDGARVDVFGDVVGYFWAPISAPLEVTSVTTPWTLNGISSYDVTATCPATYSITGGGNNWNAGGAFEVWGWQSSRQGNGWRCRGARNVAGISSGYCEAVCSRTPGR